MTDQTKIAYEKAVKVALKAVLDSNYKTSKVKELREAEKILEDYEAKKKGDPNGGFESVTSVHKYLEKNGWKCSLSTVHNHFNAGKLSADASGRFERVAVDRYAERCLSLVALDGSEGDESLDVKRKRAETRKADAQAEHWVLKTAIEVGDVIEIDVVGRVFAIRIAILKSDMENRSRKEAVEACAFFGGDESLIPEYTEKLLDDVELFFARYAEDMDFDTPSDGKVVVRYEVIKSGNLIESDTVGEG